MRRFIDFGLVVALLAALVCSADVYLDDRAARNGAQNFIGSFEIEMRRPEVARTIANAPSGDWAADIVADTALRDAYESVDLNGLSPEARSAWVDSKAHVDDELRAAQSALLDSIALRPGWAFHQSLLGEVVFTIADRSVGPELAVHSKEWSVPLLHASEAAPTDLGIWESLAGGYLRTWPELKGAHQKNAPRVFRAAFADPDFVRDVFGNAATLIGKDEAIRLLPESAKPLRAAFDYFVQQNDVQSVSAVQRRWEAAEWNERAQDLADIERHAARGDVDDVRSLCNRWFVEHQPRDFDSPAARSQTARVLALWPGGRVRGWLTNPIADACRYLLTRDDAADRFAPVVAPIIDSFDDVPPAVEAEVRARAGDTQESERIGSSAEQSMSLDWAPVRLAIARAYLSKGNPEKAEAACGELPTGTTDTHEALLIRSAIALARGDRAGSAEILKSATAESLFAGPVCGSKPAIAVYGALTPRTIRIRLSSSAPLLVDVDRNDARNVTILVDGERVISLTVQDWRDQTLSFGIVTGRGDVCAQVF